MPYKCCAVNCKGNYLHGPKVSVFQFPKDEELKLKWLKFINRNRREEYIINKSSRVCENHFRRDQVVKHSLSGRAELKPGSIPCSGKALEVHQQQLKRTDVSNNLVRQKNVSKKVFDQQQFKLTVVKTIKLHEERIKDEQFSPRRIETPEEPQKEIQLFSSLPELRELLRNDHETFTMGGKYQIVDQDRKILFLKMECDPVPKIKNSVVISDDLKVSVYGEDNEFKVVGVHRLPKTVSSIDEISTFLKVFADVKFEPSKDVLLQTYLNSAMENLNKIKRITTNKIDV